MKILGIGGSGHDFSYCIVENGNIIFAIEEERVCREKHALGYRAWKMKGLDYTLAQCGYKIEDIDIIATNNICNIVSLIDKPYMHNIVKVNHHIAHIAASYYLSPFNESTLAVLDGCGDIYSKRDQNIGEIYSSGYAIDNQIMLDNSVYCNIDPIKNNTSQELLDLPCFISSLGHFYMYMTYVCGFKYCQEGKTMGLAPYGNDRFVKRVLQHMDYDKHIFMNERIKEEIDGIVNETKAELSFQVRADLAYMAQAIVEKYIFKLLNDLYAEHPCQNLCLSGGVSLNSVMNGKIIQNTPFENVYIYPAAGDAGTSIGAALYVNYLSGDKKRKKYTPDIVYSGGSFTDEEIRLQSEKFIDKINYKLLSDEELFCITAKKIADGNICGWFQGRSEMGPRALGNRSILADPRDQAMKDRINHFIKFREDFRPFAPSILQEFANEYFETDFTDNPYMLYVGKAKKGKERIIPSVVHVDGSSRLQTVSKELNPRYYALIDQFNIITGIPVLLNTSFNIRGKPIVETPSQALKAFLDSALDFLVIGNFFIEKKNDIS